jgi:hypothetical protein
VKVKNLFYVGVHPSIDQDLRMRVIASNVVFIMISVILMIIVGLNTRNYVTHGITTFRAVTPFVLFSVSFGGIVLNCFRHYLSARLIFFLFWTAFITAFPIWRPVSVYGYFLHPTFGIVSSTMVLLMFSFRKEKLVYVLFMIFSIVITVFSFDFVKLFDKAEVYKTVLTYTTSFRLHLYPFFFSIFFNLVLIYVFRINGKIFARQQKQTDIIVKQNVQLDETRLKLEQTNNQLETRVRERTLELLEQNGRLKDYAFFHAHILRAPVSRIRGLLNLMNLPISPEEEAMVREMLSQTMKELDDTILVMNEKLQTVNITSRSEN